MLSSDRITTLRNAFALGLLSWLLVASAYHSATGPGGLGSVDFLSFLEAAKRLNSDQPLYETTHMLYVYSPLLAELLRPMTHLALATDLKIWYAFNAACLLLSVFFYAKAAKFGLADVVPIALILMMTFHFWPTVTNFALGQVNFAMLAVLCAIYWADSRKAFWTMGALIALGALVKIWMLGLLFYMLIRRQWKPVAGSIGLTIAANAALFTIAGWAEWPRFIHTGIAGGQNIMIFRVTQSLIGFADLHFKTNSFVHPMLDSHVAWIGVVAAGLIVIAGAMAFIAKTQPGGSPYEDRMRFGLILACLLLAFPSFEDEYLVLCLPTIWTLLLSKDQDSSPRRIPVLLGALAIYLIMSHSWPIYTPIPQADQHGFRAFLLSMNFFATCALCVLSLAEIRRCSMKETASEAAPVLRADLLDDRTPALSGA